jgi:hypothetical protein
MISTGPQVVVEIITGLVRLQIPLFQGLRSRNYCDAKPYSITLLSHKTFNSGYDLSAYYNIHVCRTQFTDISVPGFCFKSTLPGSTILSF